MNAQARRWLKSLTGLAAVGVLLAVGVGTAAADDNVQLRLIKNVINDNGGTKTGGDFTLYADAMDAKMNDAHIKSRSDKPSFHDAMSDVPYVLSEDQRDGYAMGIWTCDGGDLSGSTLVISSISNRDNEDRQTQRVTCTLTNDDIAPMLHLVKIVDNKVNGGFAVESDFTLTATGTKKGNDLSGPSPVDSVPGALKADTWTLTEDGPAGYTDSKWDCVVKGDENVSKEMDDDDDLDSNQIKLRVGEDATCTITNTSIAPKLHLIKAPIVNDNGGTAVEGDFTLAATGTIEGNQISGPTPVDSDGIKADTFTLSESGPAGYAGTWACDNTPVDDNPTFGDGSSSLDGNTLVLYPGEDVTCTLTNNDIPPVLQLRKVVVNDNGGTAVAADFTLAAIGAKTTGELNNNVTGPGTADSGPTLQSDTWTLSETGLAGYTASAWTCVGGTQVGTTVAVGIGGTAVCTITNDDIAPPAVVIAPPAAPVVAPPASVRGTATLRSPQGCVAGNTALTRLTARNVDHVVFIRDGRFAKRVNARGTGLQSFSLSTNVQKVGVHKVTARVFFATGATPRVTTLTHRFAQCRISPVTG